MRNRILAYLRARALVAISNGDMPTWRRCAILLDRDARRKFSSYTAQKVESYAN